MNNNYKVFPTTDGKFAICEYTQVNPRIGIWSPVDNRRFRTPLEAQISLIDMRYTESKTVAPHEEKKQVKVAFNKSDVKKSPRTSFRYTKLQKGVVVVEQFQEGEWQTVTTKKSVTKAEEYINTHSL